MASFGYIPSNIWWKDILRKIIGWPNLIKRIQAFDIIRVLNLTGEDVALDFGCGEGALTFEMAKRCRYTVGIDTIKSLEKIKIPQKFAGKMKFIVADGRHLPFSDSYFDVILASEVLPMISNMQEFLDEIKRVLKPQGRIIVVNGIGHPAIKNAYNKNSLFMRVMKKILNAPATYEEYELKLNKNFGTAVKGFYSEKELIELLNRNNFNILQKKYSFRKNVSVINSYITFFLFCLNLPTFGYHFFVLYPLFRILEDIDKNSRGSGLIIEAKKNA